MESAYSSPSSNPWLEAGAPPNIEGTPAGGAAGFGAAFGFEAAFLRPADAGRFFTQVQMAVAADFGALVHLRRLLLEAADEQHQSEVLEQLIPPG